MNKGCVIFAHNGAIDYGSQAVLAGRLAQKNLQVPVSLITDDETLEILLTKFSSLPFDKIITTPRPAAKNLRWLTDGGDAEYKSIEFINGNRQTVYDLSPYDRTLVIDSDFLILSDQLSKYWNSNYDFLITPGMNYLLENQKESGKHKISPYSIDMVWATNLMFSKTKSVKIFFDLILHIKKEYEYYSYVYNFPKEQYRNDFVFSIACHIMSGEGLDNWHGSLPIPLWFKDSDQILKIKSNGDIIFLCRNFAVDSGYTLIKTTGQDVHHMNKFDLLRNLPKLLELANG